MNLIKCSNNHFYDASKFSRCPHCNLSNPVQNSFTVPVNNGQGDVFTVPLTAPATSIQQPANMPKRDMDDVVTMPLEQEVQQVNVDSSLKSQIEHVKNLSAEKNIQNDEDDQHTIGYYHDSEQSESGIEPVVGWLVGLDGKTRGKSITIHAGRSFIGRAKTNDIVIEGDMSVSREKHAVIVFEPKLQSFLLQPGTSRELFYLNGDVVLETKKLEAYDKIEIGKTNLLFIPLCGEKFSWEKESKEEE